MMFDIEKCIISYREDFNDYRLCMTREQIDYLKECMQHSDLVSEINGLVANEEREKLYDEILNKLKEMEENYRADIQERDCMHDDPFSDGILSAMFCVIHEIHMMKEREKENV